LQLAAPLAPHLSSVAGDFRRRARPDVAWQNASWLKGTLGSSPASLTLGFSFRKSPGFNDASDQTSVSKL
jgi:hypothetical protein